MAAKLQIELIDSGDGSSGSGVRAPPVTGPSSGGGVGAGAGIPQPPSPSDPGAGSSGSGVRAPPVTGPSSGGGVGGPPGIPQPPSPSDPDKPPPKRGGGGLGSLIPQAGGVVGKVAKMLGPVGIAIGAVVGTGVILTKAVGRLIGALSKQVELLKDFSPDVAIASFESEMRKQNDLRRRATEIGPQLAKFEKSRSKMQSRMADIQTEIQKILLELWENLEPILTKMIDILEAGVLSLAALIDAGQAIAATSAANFQQARVEIKELVKSGSKAAVAIQRIFEDREDEDDPLLDTNIERFIMSASNIDRVNRRFVPDAGP